MQQTACGAVKECLRRYEEGASRIEVLTELCEAAARFKPAALAEHLDDEWLDELRSVASGEVSDKTEEGAVEWRRYWFAGR